MDNLQDLKVSVILSTYNRANMIERAIESFIIQDYRNKELIIMDDGSTDNTINVIEPFLKHDNISYFYKQNGGCASAYNFGIQKATGDLICILHDDDFYFSEKSLSILVNEFKTHDYIDVVYGIPIDFISGNGIEHFYASSNDFPVSTKQILQDDYIYLTVMMWKKSIHDKIGYFDEELKSNEDWDFEIRCLFECQCLYVPHVIVCYRRHEKNKSKINAFKMDEYRDIFKKKIKERYKDLLILK